MDLSQNGLEFIQRRESLSYSAYQDIAGVWTIGYGTIQIDGVPVRPGQTCTAEQASSWLHADCQASINVISRATAGIVLAQNQFDSLVDFAYNVGNSGFLSSTLLKMIQARQPVVADYFTRWCKARDPKTGQLVVSQGLLNRRNMEWQMYSLGVYE
jgi:lysozyme